MTISTNSPPNRVERNWTSTERRSCSALSVIFLFGLTSAACSAGDGSTPKGSPDPAPKAGEESVGVDAAGIITFDTPYLAGSCTDHATSQIKGTTDRFLTVIFSQQQFDGDPNSPDYWRRRSANSLIGGDAKSNAPKCELHIPMKVTAGYRFSPTNVILRGFAHRGFLFGEYSWAGMRSYTFERQLPPNEPANSSGENFSVQEPLQNLWSPTCSTSGGKTINAEFIASIVPYTAADPAASPLIGIDSFDVTGFGSIEKCGSPPSNNPIAQEGEHCGTIDMDTQHYVNCDTRKQTNVCVFSLTDDVTGICVNVSKRLTQSELEVGFDEQCGGPFFKYCSTKQQPLVCQFRSDKARQNASSAYGKCVERLPAGTACNTDFFGACDGYNCDTKVDPCEAGSKCSGGKCVATKTNNFVQQNDSGQSDDSGQNNGSGQSDSSGQSNSGKNDDSEQSDDAGQSDDANG